MLLGDFDASSSEEDDDEDEDENSVEDKAEDESPMMKMLLLRVAHLEQQLASSNRPKLALSVAGAAVAAADKIATAAAQQSVCMEATAADLSARLAAPKLHARTRNCGR